MDAVALARTWIVCAALQAGSAQGPAQGPARGPAQASSVAVADVPPENAEIHRFSGQQIRIAFRLYAGQGRKLDLGARPYQIAHSMAAPVGPWIEVATDVELGGEAWRDLSFTLDCPPVDRITTWELRYRSRWAGEDSWQPAGTTRIALYPPDLLQPIRSLATSEPWFVSDPLGRLGAFLTGHGIPFQDLGSPAGRQAFEQRRAKAQPALVLWVSEPVDPELPRVPRAPRPVDALERAARALVFARPSPVLPTTTLRLEPQRTRVTVDIDMLASLTDDPRAQSQLVEALRMTRIDLGEGFDE